MFSLLKSRQTKLEPVDLSKPDALVCVINHRTSKQPFGNGYRGCALIQKNYLTSSILQTLDGQEIPYETPTQCHVCFITPECYKHSLWKGREIALYEGDRHVGSMTVLEIYNPVLNRDLVLDS